MDEHWQSSLRPWCLTVSVSEDDGWKAWHGICIELTEPAGPALGKRTLTLAVSGRPSQAQTFGMAAFYYLPASICLQVNQSAPAEGPGVDGTNKLVGAATAEPSSTSSGGSANFSKTRAGAPVSFDADSGADCNIKAGSLRPLPPSVPFA